MIIGIECIIIITCIVFRSDQPHGERDDISGPIHADLRNRLLPSV